MAVTKELYERYKKLKAEGVNISLAELKQQMENEARNSESKDTGNVNPVITNHVSKDGQSSVSGNSENTNTSAFSSFMQRQPLNDLGQTSAVHEQSIRQSEQIYQNSSASYEQRSYEQSVQGSVQSSQNTAWSTTYSTPSVDRNSEIYKNYSNNFCANFSNNISGMNESAGLVNRPFESYSQASNTISSMETSESLSRGAAGRYTGNVTAEMANSVNNKILNKYCLIGYPLGHSLSTYIHNAGFKSLGIDATYDILETPPDTLVERVKYLKNNGFAGFNVTIPLKLPITLFLDKIDPSADIVGAVNTVVINPDKTLVGYNTDVIGFRNAIPSDIILAGKTAGVLGTGGAARAAITVLAQNQVKVIKIYTRNIPNSLELLNFLRAKFPMIEFQAFQIERIRDLSDVQILVNTTPIGMQGRSADMTPVEENELRTMPEGAVIYDVIYNPKKTVLIKLAQKNGYRTINGVDMFIHQAAAAEQIWTGKVPDFKDMKIAALENL